MENDILKTKFINNGLLYTPIVVPDILKDCLLILAHDNETTTDSEGPMVHSKQILLERNEEISTPTLHTDKFVPSTTSKHNNSEMNTFHHHPNPWNS